MIALPRANFLKAVGRIRAAGLAAILAVSLLPISCGVAAAPGEIQPGRDIAKLPPEVQRMRQAILQAAMSGDIEQLRVPVEMNEIHPVFAKSHISDPIAYLKSVSADGNGREMLAVLYNLLTTGYAITNPGTKEEMIVWPYHAVIPLNTLTPSQEVEIYRFLPPARVKEMIAHGKYGFYSVGISRDGVWHYFTSD
ncbi:MAG: hypothetical protein HY765_06945 [Rhodomicrobium sp.]|nr:hypothetical protein [Rhodomicrobium sp.]